MKRSLLKNVIEIEREDTSSTQNDNFIPDTRELCACCVEKNVGRGIIPSSRRGNLFNQEELFLLWSEDIPHSTGVFQPHF